MQSKSRKAALVAAAGIVCAASASRADFIDFYANKGDMPLNKAPRTGSSKLVLIPVQIDGTDRPPLDLAQINKFFGAPDATSANFRQYLRVASGGRYLPTVTVTEVVHYTACPQSLGAPCQIPEGGLSTLQNGMEFVRDVFHRAHDENKVDFSQFDGNGLGGEPDGVVDGAMIVVNVPGGLALPIEYSNSGSNLNGGTGGAIVLDGVKIPYVAVGGYKTLAAGAHFGWPLLRQFSYLLGLGDLAYVHPSSGDKYPSWNGLHYSLMGDYDNGEAATLPDPESRRALGWQEHLVISGRQTFTLQPAAAGGKAVKLGMMQGGRKEYFLAEVRGPAAGLDQRIADASGNPTWGLALYHVDWSKGPSPIDGEWTGRMLACLDCDPFHPFVRNLESAQRWSLVYHGTGNATNTGPIPDEQLLFRQGALGSLQSAGVLSDRNRYTATNWYDGSESGISIEDIIVNGDHSVTATFTAPVVSDPCSDVVCAPLEVCVQGGPVAGNCVPMQAPVADGGLPPAQPPVQTRGCSSTGGSVLGALGGLLFALALRRRSARGVSQ